MTKVALPIFLIMIITESEQATLEEWTRKLSPEFKLFNQHRFREALQTAKAKLRTQPAVMSENGVVSIPKLLRHVCTDLKREGYGVPFIWWWIAFENELLKGIKMDPWSEVKWWLWDELRGKGQTLNMWGCQNCLATETLVRMFDGGLARIDEVEVGQEMMGPDFKPRKVSEVYKGTALLIEILPENGERIICTDQHFQTVKHVPTGAMLDIPAMLLARAGETELSRYRLVRKHHGQEDEDVAFTCQVWGTDSFAGVTVDGDHRFLLADGTITRNSAKTSWMGRFAITQMAAWLVDAQVYVSGPYKMHTDDKAWAALKNWAEHLKNTKSKCMTELELRVNVQTETVTIGNASGSTAMAKFVSLEQASAVQGKKSDDHVESGMKGIVLMIVDEFIENPALRLVQADSNISSNFNYFGLIGCNPLPEKVMHPALKRFSDPVDVMNLDRTRHFRWRTAYGLCVRFAWVNSPNKILGRSAWPYLIVEERMRRQREKGNDVIDSQVDAWGFGSGARGAPLTEAEIRMSGAYSEPIWQSLPQKLMVVDCAFGGSDPASATILEYGDVMIRSAKGDPIFRRVFSGVEQVILPIDSDFHATQEWLDEMEELMEYSGGSFPRTVNISPIKPGDSLGGNWHLAYQTLSLMRRAGVEPGRVTFDSSQRGDCTNVMQDALGRENVGWYYEGSRLLKDEEALSDGWWRWPYQYTEADDGGNQRPQLWSEHCTQVSSMIWFFACELIKHGFLLNAKAVSNGLAELCARPVERGRRGQGEGRKDVLGKAKLKEMGQKSPTYAETLAIGLYFGTRFLNGISLDAPQLTTANHFETPVDLTVLRFNKGRRMDRAFTRLAFAK